MGGLRTDTKKIAVVTLFALSTGACATIQPPTDQERVAVWLSEAPRSVSVEVDPQLPARMLRERDHHGDERAANSVGYAIAGGFSSVAAGCAGGPIGCAVGLVLAPVGMAAGAVFGAVSVASTDRVYAASSAGTGPAKMELERAADLPVLLQNLVVANGNIAGPHSLHAQQVAQGEESATLRLRFTKIELVGNSGENPSLAIALRVSAEMRAPGATVSEWGSYAYTGGSHWVSTWTKNDGKVLRKELREGVNAIARQAANDLRAKPTRLTMVRVAWAQRLATDPELAMWVRARKSGDTAPLRSYLEAYPNGRYVQDAQKLLEGSWNLPTTNLLRPDEGTCLLFC